MASPTSILDDAGQRARWEGFAWTDANAVLSAIEFVFREVDR